ncbi:hypothetical protein Q1695_016203 [Nippostrongylus brasiliensis]|nr:hypothetical protein Q1695_016203 [Nippostrongylus brasiliensis]
MIFFLLISGLSMLVNSQMFGGFGGDSAMSPMSSMYGGAFGSGHTWPPSAAVLGKRTVWLRWFNAHAGHDGIPGRQVKQISLTVSTSSRYPDPYSVLNRLILLLISVRFKIRI